MIFNTYLLFFVFFSSSQQNADDNEQCDCNTCKERMRHKDELLRLRQTWSEVREAVTQVYNLCMCSDESQREKPNCLPNLKEKLRQLLWRDPHQLYQRLEQIVKDFVVEQKVKLIKLLRSQAKNPCLAQDFIQSMSFLFKKFQYYQIICTYTK